MRKKLLYLLLSIMMLLLLTGCDEEQQEKGEYQIYYLNMERSKIVAEEYDSTGAEGEQLIQELLTKLKSAPESSKLRQTIPSNVNVNSFKINGAYVYVDFSREYNALKPTEEVLVRAEIVNTLLQTDVCSLVTFTVD